MMAELRGNMPHNKDLALRMIMAEAHSTKEVAEKLRLPEPTANWLLRLLQSDGLAKHLQESDLWFATARGRGIALDRMRQDQPSSVVREFEIS